MVYDTKESVPTPQLPTCVVPFSASGRKLGLLPSSPGTDTSQGPTSTLSPGEPVPSMGGYRYINTETLGKFGTCGSSLALKEDTSVTRGLISKLSIQCKNPECRIGWAREIWVGNILCHHEHTASCLRSMLFGA